VQAASRIRIVGLVDFNLASFTGCSYSCL
jgi:hypothetical protein